MFKAIFASALTAAVMAEPFDMDQAEISRQFSVDAYCGHKQYYKHKWQNSVEGFEYSLTIYNSNTHAEGFIGYLPSDDSIYVVFKGSDDIQNFITDLNFDKDPYHTYPECDCWVHDGFQIAADSVSGLVIAEVLSLQNKHPGAKVKTTGHSLGAAIA